MHKQPTILTEVVENQHYEGRIDDSVVTLMREEGETPNGNQFAGRWVLRIDGEYIDHDQYRYDLAAAHNLILER